jgi:hypothetical protein
VLWADLVVSQQTPIRGFSAGQYPFERGVRCPVLSVCVVLSYVSLCLPQFSAATPGNVYYRLSTASADVARMSADVGAAFPDNNSPPFSPSSVAVFTWFAVQAYSPSSSDGWSTFQVRADVELRSWTMQRLIESCAAHTFRHVPPPSPLSGCPLL